MIPVSLFGMCGAGIFTFLGVFDEGGPRPYVFAWSAYARAKAAVLRDAPS